MSKVIFWRWVAIMVIAIATVIPASAQGSRAVRERYSRTDTYGDVVEVRLSNPGTLEEKMTPEMRERVRLLHVEGPMDYKDFKFIKRLCDRSSCVDSRGKKVDNYIDLELERARIISSGNGGLFGGHGDRDVLDDCLAYSSHLRSILLPDHVKRIGYGALHGCYNLEEVIMPNTVRSIDNDAFNGCSSLEYIALSEGLESIGNESFKGCSRLKKITLPRNLDEIGDRAFAGSGLQRVSLPAGLEILGAAAFEDTPITQLSIPASTRINNDDLGEMEYLEYIEVERGSRYYISEDGVLYDRNGGVLLLSPMTRKGTFVVPDGVEVIARRAFKGSAITGIDLPESLLQLGDYAFAKSHLTAVALPQRLSALPTGAFSDCRQLSRVVLPADMTIIGESAFENCSNLTEVDLPAGVAVLLPKTFKHCSHLTRITFPEALSGIGKEAFEGCALTAINLPQDVATLGERVFKNCKGLTAVVLPDACATVSKEAFRECSNLTSIDLGQGIQTLGDNALRETAITKLVLPEGITHLGKKVVEKCKSLTLIECHAVVPPKLDGTSNGKVELRVPASSIEAYKKAKHWKDFKSNTHPLE